MNLYKIATKENWTFQSTKGYLTVQQLWQLTLKDLDTIAVNLNTQFKQSKKKSFLDNEPDELSKLQLDLVLDIMETKQSEKASIQAAHATASFNAKIDSLIARKQEEKLSSLSIEELTKLKK